ncbi:MAG: ATP-binding cassette domain-containing protein [Treponema sp.]|nr:ATP-binding cassette domain-containing protein [Treponema sp.]
MIEVENVSRAFGNFLAVDNISFSIKTGEIVGLLGPNGAGKTTTMRMVTGFLESSSGIIKIDGEDINTNPREAKKKIGYMPESAPLYSDMIVEDYLKYVADMQVVNAQEKVPHLADVCGLHEVMHKNISELSRGYRQRVGLAHSLINDPEILILDEPTSGLDPNQIGEVRSLIKEIGKTRTVIISTHILSEVENLCDRVIIISKGKIVADSPTPELRNRYGSSASVNLIVSGVDYDDFVKDAKEIFAVASVNPYETEDAPLLSEGDKITCASLSISGDTDVRKDVFNLVNRRGWTLYEMSMQRNSIEDVFRTLTVGGNL